MFLGLFLLLLGVLMLLHQLGLLRGDFWDFAWPALLIAVGLAIVFKKNKAPQP